MENNIKNYIDNNKSEMYKMLKELCNIPAPSGFEQGRAQYCKNWLIDAGAENVYIVYRRGLEELPARKEEIEHAMEEGIIFKLLNNPIEIFGDDNGVVSKMKCIEMVLGEPDASGRRKPIEKENSQFYIDVDCVIMALGTSPNPLIKSTTQGLNTEKWGGIIIDETGKTSVEGVFAGGDAVTGAATVILAMSAGRLAAKSINDYIIKKEEL